MIRTSILFLRCGGPRQVVCFSSERTVVTEMLSCSKLLGLGRVSPATPALPPCPAPSQIAVSAFRVSPVLDLGKVRRERERRVLLNDWPARGAGGAQPRRLAGARVAALARRAAHSRASAAQTAPAAGQLSCAVRRPRTASPLKQATEML